MTVETKLLFNQEYIQAFSKERNEPGWMATLRSKALEMADSLEMPKPDKTKISNWNFTDFQHSYKEAAKIASLDELHEELKEYFDEDASMENLYIQRNQTAAYNSLAQKLQDKGVIFTDIFTAVREHSELVEKYYMNDAVAVDQNRLTALHAALMNGGVFVYVPKNVQVEEPLQAIFWQEDNSSALLNHVLVVAEEGSSLTYVENYISHNDTEENVANLVTEVFAHDNAQVAYGAVDNFAAGTTTYVNRRGVAKRDARIDWALGQMNDGNTVSENITYLMEDNSASEAKAVSVGRGKQTQNFTSSIRQFGKETDAYILQRGVMKGSASTIFNAIGKIEHGGTKSNSEQESRVLMLSEKSRGDANPILLIDEDDVTAGHAASVGRVDPLQMYYLMSRGLEREEAERLVIHGFLAPVVAQIPIESVRKQLTQVIERKVY